MENRLLDSPTTIHGVTNEELDIITRVSPTQLLKPQIPQSLQRTNPSAMGFLRAKTIPVRFKLIKRLTPLLILEFILPLIFIYLIVTGKEVNILFQLGLFLFLEINVMFFDFAFCNYFEG